MARGLVFAFCLALGIGGCTSCEEEPVAPVEEDRSPQALPRYQVEWEAPVRDEALERGRALLTRLECTRCHVIDEVAPAGRAAHCVNCHVWLDGLTPEDRLWGVLSERYGQEVLERYQRNMVHYQAVPELSGVARRLRPDYIGRFVAAPYDVRPSMEEAMPRIQVTPAEAETLARYFAAVAGVADPTSADAPDVPPPRRDEARIARGRELFQTHACNTCHYVGNLELGRSAEQIAASGHAALLAPNLRFVSERMYPDVVVDWIVNPRAIHEETLMPDLRVSRDDAELIRDFLWYADPELEPTPPPPSAELPAPLERSVGWAEVKERTLGRVCVHCHMNDHERDQGPGSIGGWGWPATGVRFRTYEMLVSGALVDAQRVSILEPAPGAEPLAPLLAAMLRRRDEERRDHVLPFHDHERPEYPDALPGMPMGLPSIPDDELALIRTWIEGGCPGPTHESGMPGIEDGFLVPDGPIEINHGCGVRAPSEARPVWSTREPPAWAHE